MRRSPLLICLVWLLPVFAVAQDLRDIGQLARDGAPGLALELLGQVQPDPVENFDGWLFFERQRVEIMRDWSMWQPLLARLTEFPQHAPLPVQRWAKVEIANALLQSGHGEEARAALRQLLWQPPGLLGTEEFSLYRRLVIRSYLVDDRLDDARRAMLRYTQDYGSKGEDWIRLQARVFLRNERPADAARLFDARSDADPETNAIILLAQLETGKRMPQDVLTEIQRLLKAKNLTDVQKARYWKVAVVAATRTRDHQNLVQALEQACLLAQSVENDALFAVRGDELWQAYREYALFEGNSLQLLLGQDERWLGEAGKWSKTKPEKNRALLTVVMLDGATDAGREQAQKLFLQSLESVKAGANLVRKLFLQSERFARVGAIPNLIRYYLVDDALAANNIESATRLMSGLVAPPQNSDPFEWALRRARVLILGGKADEGIAVLKKLIGDLENPGKDKIDRATQVVFDLQTVGRHANAVELFGQLIRLALDIQLRRELLYWQADSYKALNDNVHAALLYLQSATLLDGQGYDPWGQTARFQAAEVLTDAGLIDDARRQYEGLLNVTPEPGRRAAIRYKLQELWLKR